jgi:hypothetical protein
MLLEFLLQWLANVIGGIIYFLLGSIIAGVFTVKYVFPRITRSKEYKELKQELELARETLHMARQTLDKSNELIEKLLKQNNKD